jgi:hypothetical protein
MASDTLDGTKYDHSLKSLVLVLFICMLTLYAVGLSLTFWDFTHHIGKFSAGPFVIFLWTFPVMVIGLTPRWQLGTDALWQLRGKKTVIAPYTSIESVRVIKTKRNGSKIFEVISSGKTYKVDALQGDAFEKDLASRIDAARIAVS